MFPLPNDPHIIRRMQRALYEGGMRGFFNPQADWRRWGRQVFDTFEEFAAARDYLYKRIHPPIIHPAPRTTPLFGPRTPALLQGKEIVSGLSGDRSRPPFPDRAMVEALREDQIGSPLFSRRGEEFEISRIELGERAAEDWTKARIPRMFAAKEIARKNAAATHSLDYWMNKITNQWLTFSRETKGEVGGYTLPALGTVGMDQVIPKSEATEWALERKLEQSLKRLHDVNRQFAQHTARLEYADSTDINRIWQNFLHPLQSEIKKAEDEVRLWSNQVGIFNQDSRPIHDLQYSREISRATRFTRSDIEKFKNLSPEQRARFEQLKAEVFAEHDPGQGLWTPWLRPGGGGIASPEAWDELQRRLYEEEFAGQPPEAIADFIERVRKRGGAIPTTRSLFYELAEGEISRARKFSGEIAERSLLERKEVAQGMRSVYELYALGALPGDQGIRTSVALPRGPYGGHRVEFVDLVNPNQSRIGRGGIELEGAGEGAAPGIGVMYRPISAPLDQSLMSQISFQQLREGFKPQPILRAFETTARNPMDIADARETRRIYNRGFAPSLEEASYEASRRNRAQAIEAVDKKFSEEISNRIARSAPETARQAILNPWAITDMPLKGREAFEPLFGADPAAQDVGNALRSLFGRDAGAFQVTPAHVASELVGGTLWSSKSPITSGELRRSARQSLTYPNQRYMRALQYIADHPDDPFAQTVAQTIQSAAPRFENLIEEMRAGARRGQRMGFKDIRIGFEQAVAPAFGLPTELGRPSTATAPATGRQAIREAETKSAEALIRQRRMEEPRLEGQSTGRISVSPLTSYAGDVSGESEELGADLAMRRAEMRAYQTSGIDVDEPERILDTLSSAQRARNLRIRRDVAELSGLESRRDRLFLISRSSRTDPSMRAVFEGDAHAVTRQIEARLTEILGTRGVQYHQDVKKLLDQIRPTVTAARSRFESSIIRGTTPAEEIVALRKRAVGRLQAAGQSIGSEQGAEAYRRSQEYQEQARIMSRFYIPRMGPELEKEAVRARENEREVARWIRYYKRRYPQLSDRLIRNQAVLKARQFAPREPLGVRPEDVLGEIARFQEFSPAKAGGRFPRETLRGSPTTSVDMRRQAQRRVDAVRKLGPRDFREQEAYESELKMLHGWDEHTLQQFRDLVQQRNLDPFVGTSPESIFERLITAQEEGTYYQVNLPEFGYHYRRLYPGVPESEIPPGFKAQIADITRLAPSPGEALSTRDLGLTLNILGAGDEYDRVGVLAAANLPLYAKTLGIDLEAGELTARHREAILDIARRELEGERQLPRMTWQLQLQNLMRAPQTEVANTRGARLARLFGVFGGDILSPTPNVEAAEEALKSNALIERNTPLYRYSVVPNSDALNVTQPARFIRNLAAEARNVKPTSAGQAVWLRSLQWQNPEDLFNIRGINKWQARGLLVTDPRVAATFEGEHLADWYKGLLPDIEPALQEEGYTWEYAQKVSNAFNYISQRGINFGEGSGIPAEVRAHIRPILHMFEGGEGRSPQSYLYAPLATGRMITGEDENRRLFDLFGQALWVKNMPAEELRQVAGKFGLSPGNVTDKSELLRHMASQGYDISPESTGRVIGQNIAQQLQALENPAVVDYLPRQVREAIGEKAFPVGEARMEGERITAEAEVTAGAAQEAKQVIRSQIYDRVGFQTVAKLFRENRVAQGAGIGALGLAAVATIHTIRKKDHTIEDIQGPPVPGGNPYQRITPPRRNLSINSPTSAFSLNSPGVTYQVRANGNYDPQQLSNQLQLLTGGNVMGTINNAPSQLNYQQNLDFIENNY